MLAKRVLGRTGLQVAAVGLGAWAIGGAPGGESRGAYGQVAERDAHATVEAYLALGGNFIDTARRYGESERVIGEVLAALGVAQEVVVASKTPHHDSKGIRIDLEAGLRLLQRDYFDLYYLHAPPDKPDDMNRVLDAFCQLKNEGKIKAIGASIKGPNVSQDTVDLCRQYIQSGRVDVLQVIYSIFRQRNGEILAEAAEHGVGIVGRTSLESGFLTNKYHPGHHFATSDHRHRWDSQRLEYILGQSADLQTWAVQLPYEQLSQVAIHFAMEQPGISTVIVGAKSAQQVRRNMAVGDLPPLAVSLRARLAERFAGLNDRFNID